MALLGGLAPAPAPALLLAHGEGQDGHCLPPLVTVLTGHSGHGGAAAAILDLKLVLTVDWLSSVLTGGTSLYSAWTA